MTIATDLYLTRIIDNQSKVVRTAEDLVREGDWFFKRVATYTEASPFVVPQGQTLVLPIPENDIGEVSGGTLNFQYDYDNQLFRPSVAGEVFAAEIKFRCKPANNAGYLDLILEIPDYPFNPINGRTLTFNKSANEEHFFSVAFLPFVSADFQQKGAQLKVKANGTDVSIYGYNFIFVRLHSNKG